MVTNNDQYEYDHIELTITIVYSEMYAELAFLQLFVKEEIDLPQIVNADKELNRKEKTELAELEVCLFNLGTL